MTRMAHIFRALFFLVTLASVAVVSGCAANSPKLPQLSTAELAAAVPTILNMLWAGEYGGTEKFSGHTFAYAFVFYKKPGGDTLLAKYADLGPLKVTAQNARQISYEVRQFGLPREISIISDERGSGYLIAADGNVTFLATPTGKKMFINRLFAGRGKGVHSVARQIPATLRELQFAQE